MINNFSFPTAFIVQLLFSLVQPLHEKVWYCMSEVYYNYFSFLYDLQISEISLWYLLDFHCKDEDCVLSFDHLEYFNIPLKLCFDQIYMCLYVHLLA